jgi:hypothetical protein
MEPEQELVETVVARLNAKLTGVVFGLVLGFGLFLATNILVLKGGDIVGPHLGLLDQFFPGYSVTFLGSLVGFFYAFVVGFFVGAAVGFVYNKIVKL